MLRCMPTLKNQELWFLVKGKPGRFSIHEFALVMGLFCTSKPFLSLEKRTKLKTCNQDEYFNGAT